MDKSYCQTTKKLNSKIVTSHDCQRFGICGRCRSMQTIFFISSIVGSNGTTS